MKKRILATIMSVLLIVCSLLTLASCVDDNDDDGDKPDIEKPWLDDLGEHDLEGYTVKFAVSEALDGDTFHKRSIMAEEDIGDSVDAAIFARNEAIEARFNCTIDLTYYTTDSLSVALSSVFMSGGEEYDVIAARQYDDISICSKGYVVDIAKDEEVKPYIQWQDNEFPYWGERYIDGMSYKGQVYWLAGDLCLRYTGGFYCTFVNATIYEQYLSDQGSIYDIVRDKKWTIDKMKQFSDAATTVENVTIEDLLSAGGVTGVAVDIRDNTNGWAVAAGVNFSQKNRDGSVSLTFNTKNTTLDSFYTKYMELIGSKGVTKAAGYDDAFKVFASDNALMVPGRLNQAEVYLREMTSPYYIVPCPLLKEGQEYRSSVHDAINIYGISVGSQNKKATAIVLEALCAESYRSVRPRYYDDALKFKYTTDIDSAAMIDIISESSYVDFVLVWAFTDYFGGLGDPQNIGNYLRSSMKDGLASLSGLNKKVSGWNKGLKEIDAMFKKLAELEQ